MIFCSFDLYHTTNVSEVQRETYDSGHKENMIVIR